MHTASDYPPAEGVSVCFSLKCMLSMNTLTIIIMSAMSVINMYLKAGDQHSKVHICNPGAMKAEASRSQRLAGLTLIDEAHASKRSCLRESGGQCLSRNDT